MFDPKEVAQAEIGWWKSHHERDYDKVIEQMTTVYEKLYGLTRKVAQEVVMLRIKAAKEHDLAEEEGISKSKSEWHWKNAFQFMVAHFEMLKRVLVTNNEVAEILQLEERFREDSSNWGTITALSILGRDPLKIPSEPKP